MKHPIFRNTAALLVGFIVGSIVNMTILMTGMALLPPPDGIDMNDMEKFAENLKLLPPLNFATPWLGHSVGTLMGAWLAAKIAISHRMTIAIAIGILFLLGGISMVVAYGGPIWFIACDLLGAYLPTAWLGGWLACRSKSLSPASGV